MSSYSYFTLIMDIYYMSWFRVDVVVLLLSVIILEIIIYTDYNFLAFVCFPGMLTFPFANKGNGSLKLRMICSKRSYKVNNKN